MIYRELLYMSCIDVLLLQDPGGAQIGFLLGSLGVTVALSSEMTTKNAPQGREQRSYCSF